MQSHTVTLRDGTLARLFQAESGLWACPVCASVELEVAPYFGDGAPSFEMCSCGFEFGFDDDPGASAEAVKSVQENWQRWRARFIRRFRGHPKAMAEIVSRLQAIGVQVGGEDAL